MGYMRGVATDGKKVLGVCVIDVDVLDIQRRIVKNLRKRRMIEAWKLNNWIAWGSPQTVVE